MAWRTTQEDVRAIIDADDTINVAPFIDTANAVVDYVASQDSAGILTTALKEQIERYLAAHLYEYRDPQYASKSTEGASATFQGRFGMGLESNKWGQMAKRLDVTGTLSSMDRPPVAASVDWLGLPPSEQTDYVDRD